MQLEQLSSTVSLCFSIWHLFFGVCGTLRTDSFVLSIVSRSLMSAFPLYPPVNSCLEVHLTSNKERKSLGLIYTAGLLTATGPLTEL